MAGGLLVAMIGVSLFLAPTLANADSADRAAAAFRSEAGGFALTLDMPGATVCVIEPAALRNAAACAMLRTGAAANKLRESAPESFGIAMVGRGATEVLVMASYEDSSRLATRDAFERYFDRIESAMRKGEVTVSIHGHRPGSRYDFVKIGDADAVRYHVDLKQGDGAAWSENWAFPAQRGVTVVSFVKLVGDDADVLKLSQAIVQRARVDYHHPDGISTRESPAYWFGYLLGYGGPIVLFVLVVALLHRRDTKKASPNDRP